MALLNSEFLLVAVLKQDKAIAKIASPYLRLYAFAMPGLGLLQKLQKRITATQVYPALYVGGSFTSFLI